MSVFYQTWQAVCVCVHLCECTTSSSHYLTHSCSFRQHFTPFPFHSLRASPSLLFAYSLSLHLTLSHSLSPPSLGVPFTTGTNTVVNKRKIKKKNHTCLSVMLLNLTGNLRGRAADQKTAATGCQWIWLVIKTNPEKAQLQTDRSSVVYLLHTCAIVQVCNKYTGCFYNRFIFLYF